jgi:antitoxin component YwqK of YwqJK toxin-antitoxin module
MELDKTFDKNGQQRSEYPYINNRYMGIIKRWNEQGGRSLLLKRNGFNNILGSNYFGPIIIFIYE